MEWRDYRVSIPLEQGSVLRLRAGGGVIIEPFVSIPLEQGSVLRQEKISRLVRAEEVSIPLEQGSVLRLSDVSFCAAEITRLNPFGTGQCLTTRENLTVSES